jgi:transcriptional regulator with XRE-family HTH domain
MGRASMVGLAITVLAELEGLTQRQLAVRLNVTEKTISAWKKAEQPLSETKLRKVAEALHRPVQQILQVGRFLESMQRARHPSQVGELAGSAGIGPPNLDHLSKDDLYLEIGRTTRDLKLLHAEVDRREAQQT